MCGRYTLAGPDPASLRERFPVGESVQVRNRYNVAPGDDVLAVTTDREGAPRGELLRWGLVPYWAKDPKSLGLKLINARSETMFESGAFRAARRCLAFVTNDARHGEEDFVRKLWRLGFQAAREEVVTVGGALQYVLAESEHATAFVVGSAAVHRHVADAGLRILNGSDLADRADVVVLSGHDRFDYAELKGAVQAALRGAEVWCTGRDATFPMPDGPWPATGSVVAAVEAATGVRARSVGKPEPQLFLTAMDRLGDGRALVVGDRLDADVAGARAAGLDGAIVLTGATTALMAREAEPAPAFVATTLAELLLE